MSTYSQLVDGMSDTMKQEVYKYNELKYSVKKAETKLTTICQLIDKLNLEIKEIAEIQGSKETNQNTLKNELDEWEFRYEEE